jgi:D-3-phosphoglycerate dehydrogenase
MEVLITDEVHPLLITGLERMGYEVDYLPKISYAETLKVISHYSGLIINSKITVGKDLLLDATNLKWVARLGSGMEVIDTQECDIRRIKYFNSPEGNRQAVAEHALGLLLNLMRNITKANHEVKSGQWIREPNRGEELAGKTVAIIGYGNTGEAFARVMTGFDVSVLAYDKYKKGYGNGAARESTMMEIFEQADIVSLHLPLTIETLQCINHDYLSSFQKPIYLINTSRGKVLSTTALLAHLSNGLVTAAALDVLENENISALSSIEREWWMQLIATERIILTPHIAGWTLESKRKIAEVLLQKISA